MRHSSIHLLAVLIGCCSVLAVPAQGQVLTGSYTGDGTDGRQILGLGPGFVPDVVIVKGDTAQTAVIRTSTMSGDLSKPVSGTALTANLIQSLDSHGFTLGDDARVNSNGVTYHWAAFKVATDRMVVGSYTGTGTAQSVSGFGFAPEYVIVLPADAAE